MEDSIVDLFRFASYQPKASSELVVVCKPCHPHNARR
jgi:hypothetical protein